MMRRHLAPRIYRQPEWGYISRHVVDNDRREHGAFDWAPDMAGKVHPHYRHRAARILDRVPARVRPALLANHMDAYRDGGEPGALAHLAAVQTAWGNRGLSLSASDDDVIEYAEQRAAWVLERLHSDTGPVGGASTGESLRAWVAGVLEFDGLDVPDVELPGLIARITSGRWWRRKLRAVVLRMMEGAAILAGMVHIRAGVYASNEAVIRRGWAARRNAAALERATAINEAGQEYRLDELAALGVSNPDVRRSELMVRVRGVEDYAQAHGMDAAFVTWTCPSAYHARLSPSGAINPAAGGKTPKEAQAYLSGQWAKARAKLARAGIEVMGLRVAEPHHDGTPHWHLAVFFRPADGQVVRQVMRDYALQIAGDEPGAARYRFEWKPVDKARGSVTGYMLAYVTKNIDGAGMAVDTESGAGAVEGAERAIAWARTWGIRQFQFFGVPGVGPWRELRRIKELGPKQLDFFDAWVASGIAGDGEAKPDFCGYMQAVEKRPIAVIKEFRESVYPGEYNHAVIGIECGAARVITRVHTWEIRWGSGVAVAVPWTRVNNCTADRLERAGLHEFVGLMRHLMKGSGNGIDRTGGSADGAGSGRAKWSRDVVTGGRAGIDPGYVRAAGSAGARSRQNAGGE